MRGVLPDVTMTKVPSVSAVNALGAVVSDSRGSAADERAGRSKPWRRTVPTKVDPSRKGNSRGPPDSCFLWSRSRADQKEVFADQDAAASGATAQPAFPAQLGLL